MSKAVNIELNAAENGDRVALVSLDGKGDFAFVGKKIDSLDIKIFEDGPNIGTKTHLKEGRLCLEIPLLPEEFGQLSENPNAEFDIYNLDGGDGVLFDQWIVKGHNWSRDVYTEVDNDLEGRVLLTFYDANMVEPMAA